MLEPLLDQWIVANPPGIGDDGIATHSLRIRNWIWLLRCLRGSLLHRGSSRRNKLASDSSEDRHGGNHWLEISLPYRSAVSTFLGRKLRLCIVVPYFC